MTVQSNNGTYEELFEALSSKKDERAFKDCKIFLSFCGEYLGFYGEDYDDMFLAKPVFVSYKKSKGSRGKYINDILGINNEQLGKIRAKRCLNG